MTDYSDIVYNIDRLKLISQYVKDPNSLSLAGREMAEDILKKMNGYYNRVPQATQQINKGLGELGTPANNIIKGGRMANALNPLGLMTSAGLIMLADEHDRNKAREYYIQENQRRQAMQERLRNMPMEIKADPRYENGFNPLYFQNEHFVNHPTLQ